MQRSVRLLLILMLVALVGTAALAAPQRAAPEAVGMSGERLARITGLMQSYVDDGRLAGVVTMVGRHGRVVYHEAGKGPQDSAGWRRIVPLWSRASSTPAPPMA